MFLIADNEFNNWQSLSHVCWIVPYYIHWWMDNKMGLIRVIYPVLLNNLVEICRVQGRQGKRNTGRSTVSKVYAAINNYLKKKIQEDYTKECTILLNLTHTRPHELKFKEITKFVNSAHWLLVEEMVRYEK